MRRISKHTAQILAQNAGRDLERLRLKLARMRQDPFAFLRGSNPLFLDFLPRTHSLFRAPSTLVCGDLHLENFGTYKGDNRLCYFDINDFDDACVAPFTIDIVRFITGLRLAASPLRLGRTEVDKLTRCFLRGYAASIADGKPRWIERSLAQGVFRALLRETMRRKRGQLLGRLTRRKAGRRRFRIDGGRAFAVDARERRSLRRFLAAERKHLVTAAQARRFFDLEDAARRIAGNGSLGLSRYMLLIRGRSLPDENFVLDLKFAAPSAVAAWLKRSQPEWPDEAARVVSIQRTMQAISPAMLRATRFEHGPYVLKELQPSIDRLDLARLRTKPRRLAQGLEGMGHVTAWAHLRSCGHRATAGTEALQAYVAGERWDTASVRMAAAAAQRMRSAWQAYCKDYDAGAVEAALIARHDR